MAKILIVDDDYAFAEFAQLLLEGAGHRAVVCLEGGKALETALTERPDAILADLGMPDMNGLDVMRQLKADPAARAIPVLVCSMTQNQWEIDEAIRLGGVAFLDKPLKAAELNRCLNEVVPRA